MAKNLYCWYEYYWGAPVHKNVKGDELRFYTGHQHGVVPTDANWESCQPSLYANVGAVGRAKRPPVDPPSNDTILENAVKKTRSARGG